MSQCKQQNYTFLKHKSYNLMNHMSYKSIIWLTNNIIMIILKRNIVRCWKTTFSPSFQICLQIVSSFGFKIISFSKMIILTEVESGEVIYFVFFFFLYIFVSIPFQPCKLVTTSMCSMMFGAPSRKIVPYMTKSFWTPDHKIHIWFFVNPIQDLVSTLLL